MDLTSNLHGLRLLVGLTSYGDKNIAYLRKVIRAYQELPLQVRIIVFSEAPKNLGNDVEVNVGLPSKNPWSLAFAHKTVFERELNNYDLFIYAEDDVAFSERNIQAFLRATPELAPDEIAGFLLYEKDEAGAVWLPGFWSHFHWRPDSVKRRESYTIAEFTNAHSAGYLITQTQLRQAIASGGFMRKPHQGEYDMLCSAATDPYRSCGFRKVICISALEDFLLHHTPDCYTKISYVSLSALKEQVQTLFDIRDGLHPASSLWTQKAEFWHGWWQKQYYENAREELVALVPPDARTILSIGYGCGTTEARLRERGAELTVISLDSVVGAEAARNGMEVIYGSWETALRSLDGRQFDCVMMNDLLHLHPNPGHLLEQCSFFVGENGTLVLGGPNFDRLPWWIMRSFGIGKFRKLRNFELSGIQTCGPRTLQKNFRNAGLQVVAVEWLDHKINRGPVREAELPMGKLMARRWALQARRTMRPVLSEARRDLALT